MAFFVVQFENVTLRDLMNKISQLCNFKIALF